jgi:hypothetical protein
MTLPLKSASGIQPELMARLQAVARAIDDVLIAEHGPRSALKAPPPWDASLSAGIERYGAGPVFDLWALCCRIEALRIAWTGRPGPAVEVSAAPVPPVDEPDEAPGMAVEAPVPADDGTENQQRLGGR